MNLTQGQTSMTNDQTTIKTRSADVPTDLALARNQLAIAMKAMAENRNQETSQAVQDAQAEVHRLEDVYRVGRMAQLTALSDRMARGGNHVNR